MQAEIFDLLFNSAEISKFTLEEKVGYEHDMTTERDIRNQIEYAKAQGIEQGAGQKAMEIARKMLADGLPASTVSSYTGLTGEQLMNL